MELERYIEELRQLVNTDSGTATLSGVAKMAEMMRQKYRDMGWHAEMVDLGDDVGPGVWATNKPDAEQFDVLLFGHMDTVFPEGTAAARPFTVEGNIARGPGVADMKSGLLSIVYALRALDQATLDRLAIGVVMNASEEVASDRARDWIADCSQKSRCVLVFEGARADGSLVKARKGISSIQIDFKGVAAHAGNDPQKGRSAVVEMAHWIQALAGLNDYAAGTTVNVGTVNGGTASNVVPDHASMMVDVRFWKTSEAEKIEQALATLQSKTFTPDITVTVTRLAFKPAMEVSGDTKGLMTTVEEIGAAMHLPIRWSAVGGGSDANISASLGIPTLDGLGPIGANYHGEAEYMQLDSVMPRIQLAVQLLQRL
ncbi:MAG: M20 family metallopeptidase [Paludibacterium sp.]|uniref:M20 family metallopeptidase n=1 Tax=Paludibacterium sp. TaxID=1917523 RepID=UPI0025CEC5C9|nr:M20 family metallopeptidase [Paludibacterium sp.]MBV8047679.1 M20 family metallopeptidase [Paludibacterium sp.]